MKSLTRIILSLLAMGLLSSPLLASESASQSNYHTQSEVDYLIQKYEASESYLNSLFENQSSDFKQQWMNKRDKDWRTYKESYRSDRGQGIYELNGVDTLLVRHQFRIQFNNANQTDIENGVLPD